MPSLLFPSQLCSWPINETFKEKDFKRWNWIVVAIWIFRDALEILTHNVWTRSQLGITGTLFVIPVILSTAQLVFNPDLKISMKIVSIGALC